jgi:hypothetical protein
MPKGSDRPDDADGLSRVPNLVFRPEAFEGPEWLKLQAAITAFEEERKEMQVAASIPASEVVLKAEEQSTPNTSAVAANSVKARVVAIICKQAERFRPFLKLLRGMDDGSGKALTGDMRVEADVDPNDPLAVFRNAPVTSEVEDALGAASDEIVLPDDGDFLLHTIFRSDQIKIGDVVYVRVKLSNGLDAYVDVDRMRSLLRDNDSGCIIASIQPVVRENFGDRILISVTFYYGKGSRTTNAYMDIATGDFLRTSNTGKLIRLLSHGGDIVADKDTGELCKFVTLVDATECYVGFDTLEEKLPTQIS